MVAIESSLWQRQQQSRAERAAELAALERASVRAERLLLAQTLIGCLMCCATGLFLISWAAHTTNSGWGGIAFWSGLLVGDIGTFGLLLRHAHCAASAEF